MTHSWCNWHLATQLRCHALYGVEDVWCRCCGTCTLMLHIMSYGPVLCAQRPPTKASRRWRKPPQNIFIYIISNELLLLLDGRCLGIVSKDKRIYISDSVWWWKSHQNTKISKSQTISISSWIVPSSSILFYAEGFDWLMLDYIALFSALLSRLAALACGSTWVTGFL